MLYAAFAAVEVVVVVAIWTDECEDVARVATHLGCKYFFSAVRFLSKNFCWNDFEPESSRAGC